MDQQDLQVGDSISPTLRRAIKNSWFAIVVLSKNYASSTWCLEELAKICPCMKDNKRILQHFYHVDPADVQHQKRNFEDAFTQHGKFRRHVEKVLKWKDAPPNVSSFSGWHTLSYSTEVKAVVEEMCSKVRAIENEFTEEFEVYEATKEAKVGVMNALADDKVTAVGVYGMGGVGKTILVKHVGEQAKIKGLFDYVIMVVVSQSPDLRKIKGAIVAPISQFASLARAILSTPAPLRIARQPRSCSHSFLLLLPSILVC